MGSEIETILRCTFCGKGLSKTESVRYRGALSCNECAQAQEPFKDFRERPFFILGAFGTLIGLFVVTLTVLQALTYILLMWSYAPPLIFYFGGLAVALVLQGFGVYALNQSEIPIAGKIGALVAFVSAFAQSVAIWDLIVDGPFYIIDNQTFTKGFGYYPFTVVSYTLFSLIVGLGILLQIGRTRIDNTTIVAGSMYLVGGSIGAFSYSWPPVGFLHIFMYAAAFFFFFTKKEFIEKDPIETLDYKTVNE